MPVSKKNVVEADLDWLENRANEIKKEIDANPYNKIKDRIVSLVTTMGTAEKVVAKAEEIKKAQREALKDYQILITGIKELREKEEKKQMQIRGDQSLSPFESGDI